MIPMSQYLEHSLKLIEQCYELGSDLRPFLQKSRDAIMESRKSIDAAKPELKDTRYGAGPGPLQYDFVVRRTPNGSEAMKQRLVLTEKVTIFLGLSGALL